MIRFIASDLDGTLLNKGVLPEGTFDIINRLYDRGVLFAPASGRQYANLSELFAPVRDKVVFICENGALVKYRGETLYLNPIPNADIHTALREIRALPHLFPMLCGVNAAYIENREMPFYRHAVDSYTNCELVDDLDAVVGREDVCKIAIYDEIGSAENCIKKLPAKIPGLRTILSGVDWCDVSAPTADKGAAMRFLQKKFSLKKEECAAFGDHMNDYEMLLECGSAYVVENAFPPLVALIRNTVPANTENGVLNKMIEILDSLS